MPVSNLPTLAAELGLLKQAGIAAGELALSFFGKDPKTWIKPGNSPVSEADFAVDVFLKKYLLDARPDYGWLSEEMDEKDVLEKRQRSFIIDPIDGTRGFLEGSQYWCISLAIIENGHPIVGVLQCPVTKETYTASSGGGAMCNNKSIHCSHHNKQDKWLVSAPTALQKKLPQSFHNQVTFFKNIPSLAYRLALAASGKIDAVLVRPKCHDWDIAGADLILNEAGGSLLNLNQQPVSYGISPYKHDFLVGAQKQACIDMIDIVEANDIG